MVNNMAERRMFSKRVIDSDLFLDMPATAQLLYFHLAMRADDDGFIKNPKSIMRIAGCKDDDMKILIAKKLVIPFESGIVVISHWKIHNYIAKDRYKPTDCKEKQLLKTEDSVYKLDTNCIQGCIQPVDEMYTQDRLGKDRLGKDSNKQSKIALENFAEISPAEPRKKNNYQAIVDDYNQTCTRLPKCIKLSDARKKAIAARLKRYSVEELHTVFEKAEASDFLCGCNARNWMANFDWLLKDANMAKVIDGNYDNEKPAKQPANQYDVDLSSVFS